MVFSDTSTKLGIIQRIEKWCNFNDGYISGNSTLLKIFTGDVNEAFDETMPLLLSYTSNGRFDDLNNTTYPIATFNLVSGQADYSIKTDGDNLDILRIFDLRFLPSSSATQYQTLPKLTLNDSIALDAMSPNPNTTGQPNGWLERDNTAFLTPPPNYSATAGIKIYYERIQSYFASTDTTKVPGFPRIFHPLLPLIVSRDWISINKPDNVTTLSVINSKISVIKQAISDSASARNPQKGHMNVGTNPDSRARQFADSNK